MPYSHPTFYDVVIAGAGPVGLFLACELGLAGLSVIVLEQAATPSSPLKQLPFGMRGLSSPTNEALYRRGLLDAVSAVQPAKAPAGAHWMQQARRPAGHFAGIQFFENDIDASRWPYRLSSPAAFSMAVDLQSLESVLAEHADTLGVEIMRGLAVDGLEQLDDHVMVAAGGEHFAGRWLVGCDGGRSAVRKLAGFAFVGTEPEFTGYSLEIALADPDILPVGRHFTPNGMFTYARPGTVARVDFDGGAFHRTRPITPEHVQSVLRRVTVRDVTLSALLQATTWTDRAHQATDYRRGRVLLAGDAAHIHSPLGGQGLNLGLGDAMNLGWKLASTVHGAAPTSLLDSYAAERHPVGVQVLDWSRAQVAIMRPGPSSRALEAIIRDLIETRDGATYFAERVWGVSLRYDLGDAHPLLGRSAPDFALTGGVRLGALMREGRGALLDFNASAPLRTLASRWGERIAYIAGDAEDRLGLSAVLVRPDGIVAWTAETELRIEEFERAAIRWFGEPKADEAA